MVRFPHLAQSLFILSIPPAIWWGVMSVTVNDVTIPHAQCHSPSSIFSAMQLHAIIKLLSKLAYTVTCDFLNSGQFRSVQFVRICSVQATESCCQRHWLLYWKSVSRLIMYRMLMTLVRYSFGQIQIQIQFWVYWWLPLCHIYNSTVKDLVDLSVARMKHNVLAILVSFMFLSFGTVAYIYCRFT